MMPTLIIGDHLMVAKTKRIAAGDLVVFRYPLDRDITYMKRVVAVGGQTIEIKDGVVWVDGIALKQWSLVGDCPSSGESDTDERGRAGSAGERGQWLVLDHARLVGVGRRSCRTSFRPATCSCSATTATTAATHASGVRCRSIWSRGVPRSSGGPAIRSGTMRWNRIGLKID